jgi:hypothetical protein
MNEPYGDVAGEIDGSSSLKSKLGDSEAPL